MLSVAIIGAARYHRAKTNCSDVYPMRLIHSVFLPFLIAAVSVSFASHADASLDTGLTHFDQLYQTELGGVVSCQSQTESRHATCSSQLKNEGNAPFVLHHAHKTQKVFVLFHGLSDSPFFLTTVAQAIHKQGHNVLVALLPGHGKKDADQDMQDPELAARWRSNVQEMIALAPEFGEQLYLGGFSTGGALSAEYILEHPGEVKGLLLFSGALALDSSVETMASIWGIKWLAKTLDGDYQSMGPNPFKYPSVARYSAFQLTDVIFSVRDLIKQQKPLDIAIFAAHSEADNTTPISGVKDLMAYNKGQNTLFLVDKKFDVCHADVVVNEAQIKQMNFDESQVTEILPCSIPSANPQHAEMLEAMSEFIRQY
ncbi:MAG: alpha/beta hydrolase [Paraglaciecola chathamensis]